jgi:uncharacterized membrane protein
MKLQTIVCYSVAAAIAGTGEAQTRIDLRTQGKSVDFSALSSTRPSQIGTQLPSTCLVGATFVLITASAGQNWYLCTTVNQWTVQGTTLPSVSGNTGTVLSTDGASLIWKTLGGDINGSPASVTVSGLLGRKLNTTAPTTGQLLAWDGTQWSPQTITGTTPAITSLFGRTGAVTAQTGDYSFSQIGGSVASAQLPLAGGDLSGALTSATVTKIQNRAIGTGAPATGQVLTWSGTQWTPQNQTGGVASVTSLFGRTGVVTSQAGDYTASQVTNAADKTILNSYSAGARQTFSANLNAAGIQIAPGPLPSIGSAGDLVVDGADSNLLKVYNGISWITLNPNITFPPGNYVTVFTSQTSISVLGSAHGLGTPNLIVQCYDNATPANLVEPSLISIDPNNYNVTVAFATAETGRCVFNGYNGGGGGSQVLSGAGMAAQLGDFAVVRTSPNALSIGGNCSPATPCNVRFGTQVYSITAAAGVTLNSGNGLEYIYIDPTGVLSVGSSLSASCSGSCIVVPGVTGFPINSIPLYTWAAANGAWDATGGVDRRGWLSSNPVLGGPGIATVAVAGQTTISVDSAVVPTYLTASATLDFPLIAAGTCSSDLTFSLPGASPGDAVATGWPAGLEAGLSGTMRVSGAGVISVRLCADATGAVNPASATFTAMVVRGF